MAVEEADLGVEAPDSSEQVGAYEQGRLGHGEHVRFCVVLALVNLAGVQAGHGRSVAVDGAAHVVEDAALGSDEDLGADHAGVGGHRTLHHASHGGAVEHNVVVHEQVVAGYPVGAGSPVGLVARGANDRPVGCCAEAGRAGNLDGAGIG